MPRRKSIEGRTHRRLDALSGTDTAQSRAGDGSFVPGVHSLPLMDFCT
jgi:hypothetical protein